MPNDLPFVGTPKWLASACLLAALVACHSDGFGKPVEECIALQERMASCMGAHMPLATQEAAITHTTDDLQRPRKICIDNLKRPNRSCP
jgi:hypothetical protein